ncbi:MAG: archease [Methanobacteriota archaeon]
MCGRYEYFEHTADVGVKAYGSSLAEIFSEAAKGLAGVVCDLGKVRALEVRAITVESGDLEALLVAWLSEMLFYMDSEQLLLCEHDIEIELGGAEKRWTLRSKSRGERMDPERHGLRGGIKAVTYHMLEVNEEKGYAKVLLDI